MFEIYDLKEYNSWLWQIRNIGPSRLGYRTHALESTSYCEKKHSKKLN